MNQAMTNYQTEALKQHAQNQGLAGLSGPQVKPDGAFTQRIRAMAGRADEHEFRLRNILRSLRVAPPEPPQAASSGLNIVHTTVEDQLARHENAQANIEAAINELEGLFS